jgi:hypothetical protein
VSDTRDWQELEAAALDAALETRRHMRRCPVCSAGDVVCRVGAGLLVAADRGIGQLGDHMTARARVAAALKG